MFIPITKIDAVKREVWGTAGEESPDKSGEIMDWDSSVPLWREWSKSIQDASGGKSLGNVRGMHNNVAAGKVIAIEFNDQRRTIPVGVKVVDDNEWRKVEEGVYTGFSVGGKYEKIWQDGANKRYTARPSEISLVDNPCMYGATFQMVKADGVTELRKFEQTAVVDKREEEIVSGSNLQKAGARHSATDNSLIQEMHDKSVALGAECKAVSKLHKDAAGLDTDMDADSPAEEPAAWTAFTHSLEISNVADALGLVARIAGSMADTDPVCASKLTEAVTLITEALAGKAATMSAAMQAATAEEAAEKPELEETAAQPSVEIPAEVLEQAVKATLQKMLPDLVALSQTAPRLTQNQPAKAALGPFGTEGLSKLESSVSDLTARLGAFDERLKKAEHPDSGPVLREVAIAGAFAGNNNGMNEDAVLAKLIAEEPDPAMRQRLMMKRAEASIRNVQARGGNPIR